MEPRHLERRVVALDRHRLRRVVEEPPERLSLGVGRVPDRGHDEQDAEVHGHLAEHLPPPCGLERADRVSRDDRGRDPEAVVELREVRGEHGAGGERVEYEGPSSGRAARLREHRDGERRHRGARHLEHAESRVGRHRGRQSEERSRDRAGARIVIGRAPRGPRRCAGADHEQQRLRDPRGEERRTQGREPRHDHPPVEERELTRSVGVPDEVRPEAVAQVLVLAECDVRVVRFVAVERDVGRDVRRDPRADDQREDETGRERPPHASESRSLRRHRAGVSRGPPRRIASFCGMDVRACPDLGHGNGPAEAGTTNTAPPRTCDRLGARSCPGVLALRAPGAAHGRRAAGASLPAARRS